MALDTQRGKGLFPGRFQPFTIQHERRVEQILHDYPSLQLIIVVGDVGTLNKLNFLTVTERLEMITELADVKHWDRVSVVEVKGAPPAKWIENVVSATGKFDFVFSNNPFVRNPLKQTGCTVVELDSKGLSSTFVRSLDSFEKWKEFLPDQIYNYIEKYNLYQRFREMKDGQKYPFLINGSSQVGLIGGEGIHKYSVAKEMWTCCFAKMGIPFSFEYLPITSRVQLKTVVKMLRKDSWVGANVALPWKKDIIEYIDGVDAKASVTGLVNCIKYSGGKILGTNTDGQGFVESLNEKAFNIKGISALIIGAGGAGISIGAELAASGAAHVHFVDIARDSMRSAAKIVRQSYPEVSVGLSDNTDLQFDLVVNCSGVGAAHIDDVQNTPLDMKAYNWANRCLFVEATYNPINTKFLINAAASGYQTMSGIYMLGMQAYYSHIFYSGDNLSKANRDIFLECAEHSLISSCCSRENGHG